MVMKELVQDVHEELKRLHDEAVTNRENPRLISVMEQLMRLTDVTGTYDPKAPSKLIGDPSRPVGEMPTSVLPEKVDAATCPHKVADIYGICKECGTCTHAAGSRDGICSTCGEPVKKG